MKDWETYWRQIKRTGDEGQVFWDCISEQGPKDDLQRFIGLMDPSLPLLDLGCGNGRQTRFFAGHFAKVIGVDVSASAIRLAESESTGEENVEYLVFDAVDTAQAEALHKRFGDVNIYMRGVLHMIKRLERDSFIRSLEILLGERGTLYQLELPSKSILHLRSLPEDVFSTIPKITRRVGFNMEERESFYPNDRWIVLDEGSDASISTIPLSDGREDAVPANYLILRRRIPTSTPTST